MGHFKHLMIEKLNQMKDIKVIFHERQYEPPFIQLLPINEFYKGDRLKIQRVMGDKIEFTASIDGAVNAFRISVKELLILLEKLNDDGGTNFTKSSADDFPTESLISVKRESADSPNSPHDSSTIKEEANFS